MKLKIPVFTIPLAAALLISCAKVEAIEPGELSEQDDQGNYPDLVQEPSVSPSATTRETPAGNSDVAPPANQSIVTQIEANQVAN